MFASSGTPHSCLAPGDIKATYQVSRGSTQNGRYFVLRSTTIDWPASKSNQW